MSGGGKAANTKKLHSLPVTYSSWPRRWQPHLWQRAAQPCCPQHRSKKRSHWLLRNRDRLNAASHLLTKFCAFRVHSDAALSGLVFSVWSLHYLGHGMVISKTHLKRVGTSWLSKGNAFWECSTTYDGDGGDCCWTIDSSTLPGSSCGSLGLA